MGKHVVDVTLRVADRCDVGGCGAQAYIRATLLNGLDLLWCAHHGAQHKATMADRVESWQDETFRLTEKRVDNGDQSVA